jgi:hypothetical protein
MDFPKGEAQIITLCDRMLSGYSQHWADFPKVKGHKLSVRRSSYATAKKLLVETRSRLKIETKATNEKLLELKKVMKNCLRKSMVDVAANPEKLKLIGWGLRDNPQQVQPPGQPTNLQIITKDNRMIKLKWDLPTDGQRVRNFVLERRRQNGDEISDWQIHCISYQTQINLTNQPIGVHLEYRVKAVNIAGQSSPSNIAAIVL